MAGALKRAAARAEAWLEGKLSYLAPPTGGGKAEMRRLKALCEIGFLTTMRASGAPTMPLARAVADLISEANAGGRFLAALWHQPNHANLYLPMLYTLAHSGRLCASERADLAKVMADLRRSGIERIPFRSLDFMFSDALLTGARNFDRMEAISEFGCVPPEVGLARCSRHDDYALTHTIFYLTAFGTRRWPAAQVRRARLAMVLTAMRAAAEHKRDWDLGAEFLAAEMMLGMPVAPAAVNLLAAAQHEDGSWPGPADLDSALRADGIADPAAIEYYSRYHTTLVAWMALSMYMNPGFFCPASLEPAPAMPAASFGYPTLPEAWRDLRRAFRRLGRGGREWSPPEDLWNDPQSTLTLVELRYWRDRLGEAPAEPMEADESKPIAEAALDAQAWRKLRCLLLMTDGEGLDAGLREAWLRRVLGAISKCPASAVAETDRIVCAGLLATPGDDVLAQAASKRLLLAVLERDVFSAGPIAAFLHPWIDSALLREARSLLVSARSRSLPFGFMFGGDASELRRSLACETYLDQMRAAETVRRRAGSGRHPKPGIRRQVKPEAGTASA